MMVVNSLRLMIDQANQINELINLNRGRMITAKYELQRVIGTFNPDIMVVDLGTLMLDGKYYHLSLESLEYLVYNKTLPESSRIENIYEITEK